MSHDERYCEVENCGRCPPRSPHPPSASPHQNVMLNLPTDAAERKQMPVCSGLLDYFPMACAAVAELSLIGNQQHNPGEPLNWARGKSTDQADTIVRHLMERGTLDTDSIRHSTKVAWRALAMLQEELEALEGWSPEGVSSTPPQCESLYQGEFRCTLIHDHPGACHFRERSSV